MIASDVKIAPTAIIGENVSIGAGTTIADYVIIRDNVSIGENCKIYSHVVIGEDPQDFSYQGEATQTIIGNNNTIREFASIHTAVGEGNTTELGDDNFIMAYSHIGHNCKLAHGITMANAAQLAGHVTVEEHVTIGGLAAIHQNCTIGAYCMFSGMAATNKDIPPYFIYALTPAIGVHVNRHALKKHNFSREARNELMTAFKIIYKEKGSLSAIIEKLQANLESPEAQRLIEFLKNSKRGIRLIGH